jgi:GDPmannose 4,6-dehydratase
MLQGERPADYVICTGETNPLSAFVDEAFAVVGLNARDHVDQDSRLFRPADLRSSVGSPAKAREQLGWSAKYKMRDVVHAMVRAKQSQMQLR